MDAQFRGEGSQLLSIREGKTPSYPTRSDTIITREDRQNWIGAARDIMTQGGEHPENIAKIAEYNGSRKIEVLKSFVSKKPQRSLWNILICIIQSTQKEKIVAPTVSQLDTLFEELNPPKSSPALESYKMAHPDPVQLNVVVPPKKHLLDMPVVAHTSRRTRGILAQSNRYDTTIVTYYSYLTPKTQEVFRLFYGYTGIGDPADPASYDAAHCQSISMIAIGLGLSYQTVYVRFRKIAEIIAELTQQEGDTSEEAMDVVDTVQEEIRTVLDTPQRRSLDIMPDVSRIQVLTSGARADFLAYYGYRGSPHDPTLPASYDASLRQSFDQIAENKGANRTAVYMQVYNAYKKLQELAVQNSPVTSEVQLPSFLQERRPVTPLPKRPSTIVPEYRGDTKPTQVSPSRVIRPSQPIPTKFVPSPRPSSPQTKKEVPTFSFEELVGESRDVRTIPKKSSPQSEPIIKKQLREIPHFTSYREALEWGQKQVDWVWGMNLWKNSTLPIHRDNLGLLHYLRASGNRELQDFFDQVRTLSGNTQLKYIKILDTLLAPLPEEKIGMTEIQNNPQWMGMIGDIFVHHASKKYPDVMEKLKTIFSDEKLGKAVFEIMPEYETTDYMDILALIAGKNWTSKDSQHYISRTLKDVFRYKKGTYADLDRVFTAGAHVKQKMLETTLKNIPLQIPLGETQWPRYREYDTPRVTLYDVVIARVKKDGGDMKSSKVLFHTLEELIV